MANETLYKGDIRILYIKESVTWFPVACLTGNPFTEEVDMLNTTTRLALGWETSIPTKQRYSIDFNGLQILTLPNGDDTKMSYDRLKTLKRDRTLIEWKIEGVVEDTGFGYIHSIGESNEVDGFLEFNGSITGVGIT